MPWLIHFASYKRKHSYQHRKAGPNEVCYIRMRVHCTCSFKHFQISSKKLNDLCCSASWSDEQSVKITTYKHNLHISLLAFFQAFCFHFAPFVFFLVEIKAILQTSCSWTLWSHFLVDVIFLVLVVKANTVSKTNMCLITKILRKREPKETTMSNEKKMHEKKSHKRWT